MTRRGRGLFHITKSTSSARISVTGQAYVEIGKQYSFSAREGVTLSSSTSYSKIYRTTTKTYVMNISASNL